MGARDVHESFPVLSLLDRDDEGRNRHRRVAGSDQGTRTPFIRVAATCPVPCTGAVSDSVEGKALRVPVQARAGCGTMWSLQAVGRSTVHRPERCGSDSRQPGKVSLPPCRSACRKSFRARVPGCLPEPARESQQRRSSFRMILPTTGNCPPAATAYSTGAASFGRSGQPGGSPPPDCRRPFCSNRYASSSRRSVVTVPSSSQAVYSDLTSACAIVLDLGSPGRVSTVFGQVPRAATARLSDAERLVLMRL